MRHRSARVTGIAAVAAAAVLAVAACGSNFNDSSSGKQASGPAKLQVLIASSGDAETKAVKDAAASWASSSGNTATVTPASDIAQQLGQAFAGSNPPDVFYVDAARFADYASVGALLPYADTMSGTDDFYPSLRTAFTYQNKFYCIPKDFSTIAMEINTDLWSKAGLTTADVPKTWDQLTSVAQRLKTAHITPIAIGDTRDRVDAFLAEAGGSIVNQDGTTATADSPQNLQALQYVQSLLKNGLAQYPKQLSAGWAGEAFGKGKAAITFEGNWIEGSMRTDFPNIKYTVNPMPTGPKGAGTLSFTQCWGISAKTKYKDQAIKFVQAMTSATQEMTFAKAFGVMPSRQSVRDQYLAQFPTDKAFLDGADYAQGPVNAPKMDSVLADFDSGIQQLATTDPRSILQRLQKNTQAALAG
ncbi:ABC transporter substrate-binding protein [Rugosimonospora acidiphila]|uniref:ABC transporter substrate-binding protein n=1 Tax=Rugosimonospora acidiphila TaxID=556531 RepID=A0ABP9SSS7_9ACTN